MDEVFTYSPHRVLRYKKGYGASEDILIAEYEDATVRDQGKNNALDTEEAMLRAYSPDVNFYGDEDYQQGNGIGPITTKKMAKMYKLPVGTILDCDGDLALKRIMMNAVLSFNHWGHGDMDYVGLVNYDEEDDEYNGWGYSQNYQMEIWRVRRK